jgi:[ribosomal protein S5]-alanine N-acetyltransferase
MKESLPMELFSPRLRYREFQPEDWQLLYYWSRDPDQTRYDSTPNLTRNRARHIVDLILNNRSLLPRRQFDFVLERRDTRSVVGSIYLAERDRSTARRAEIGYRIVTDYWNQGYATEAARRIVEFAANVGIRTVYARVMVENGASARVLEKVGMAQIDFEENGLYRNGQWRPMATYQVSVCDG